MAAAMRRAVSYTATGRTAAAESSANRLDINKEAIVETIRASRIAMRGVLFVLTGLAVCLAPHVVQAQPSSFRLLQKPGPYRVGLKVVDQYDHSRSFPLQPEGAKKLSGIGARPVQTLIWYPSSGSTGMPMTVGDYARLALTEIHFDAPDQHNEWESKLATSANERMWAVRDAALAKGNFPVVVYAPGQSSVAWDNADLCEYLASHGYVVLASPSLGAATRDADDNLSDIDAEARDISFLVSFAALLPDTDISKVAVAGWSWGGISNLFAAARDSRIKALAAFDGSMRYYPGLVEKAGDVYPERMTIPLLFFTRGNLSLEDWNRYHGVGKDGPNVLNAWSHGDLLTVRMLGMSHPEFASMYQRKKNQQQFAEDQVADYGRDDANVSYAWVARYTLRFLDAYLKSDASATTFLKNIPTDNGVPKHFISAKFHAAGSSP
jgi:dienelactone hydrolase